VLVKSLTFVRRFQSLDVRHPAEQRSLSEVNSHDIDTLRWFSGSEFEEVYAIAGNYRSPDARNSHPDFYDNVVLSARMKNGMQARSAVRRVSVTVTTPAARSSGKTA